jgi:Uma2 family endonuclease
MQAATQSDYVSVADYLNTELTSDIRHEYLGGLVYAMAGETRAHNQISGNLYLLLRQHVRGGPCRVYMADVRVNFKVRQDEYYYYPDIVVTCDPSDNDKRLVRSPKLIIQVLSQTTERVDKREQFFAYTNIESLEEYVLVPQERVEATVFRRTNGWQSEQIEPRAELLLNSLQLRLPLAAAYEGL